MLYVGKFVNYVYKYIFISQTSFEIQEIFLFFFLVVFFCCVVFFLFFFFFNAVVAEAHSVVESFVLISQMHWELFLISFLLSHYRW